MVRLVHGRRAGVACAVTHRSAGWIGVGRAHLWRPSASPSELTRKAWLKGVGSSLDVYDPFAELAMLPGAPTTREAQELQGERMFRSRMRHSSPCLASSHC